LNTGVIRDFHQDQKVVAVKGSEKTLFVGINYITTIFSKIVISDYTSRSLNM